MRDNDNKRGFSGLSNLTSDIQTSPQIQTRQSSTQSSAHQKSVFALLEFNKWPTLPAPWSSVDAGETWVWGDFFMTFQKQPKTVIALGNEMLGRKAEYQGMIYHYAMSVFYHIDKNPRGQFHRPIMTIALEQADMGMLSKILNNNTGQHVQAKRSTNMGPLMIGLFTSESRFNFGEYEGSTGPQAVKQKFFEILGQRLGVSGQPKMIGDLAQAFGHPETGLPAKTHNTRRSKSGMSKVTYAFFCLIALLAGYAFFVWIFTTDKPSTPSPGPKPYQANPAQVRPKYVRPNTAPNGNGAAELAPTGPITPVYVRPNSAPNGKPWPVSAGYVRGYKSLHEDGLSTVTVDNSRNDSDVFVKLVSLDSPQAYPVRQFYIPAFGRFTLNKITAGSYDIRYRDLGNGGLSRSEAFNLEEIETSDGVQYSNITMTLYKVQNGNMQTYSLSEAEF
jgi:hypothetical protein